MREIERNELERLLAADEAVVVEVLPEPEFERLHIDGAINIPLERIGRVARQRFKPDQPIVLYCSDHDCPSSGLAASKLDAFGFTAVMEYAGGKADWEEAGLPMATGPVEDAVSD